MSSEPIEVAAEDPLDTLGHEVAALQQRNTAEMQTLARQGVQVDPSGMILVRVGMLCDTLLGPEMGEERTAQRLVYERNVQQVIGQQIEQIKSNVRQQILMQGLGGGRPPMPGHPG